jgi:hypothetical protein
MGSYSMSFSLSYRCHPEFKVDQAVTRRLSALRPRAHQPHHQERHQQFHGQAWIFNRITVLSTTLAPFNRTRHGEAAPVSTAISFGANIGGACGASETLQRKRADFLLL